MRIYVKHNNRRFIIPAPLGLLKFAISIIEMPAVKKNIGEEERKYLDYVDFKELKNGIDLLKQYKGLNLAEVITADGKEIKIII